MVHKLNEQMAEVPTVLGSGLDLGDQQSHRRNKPSKCRRTSRRVSSPRASCGDDGVSRRRLIACGKHQLPPAQSLGIDGSAADLREDA